MVRNPDPEFLVINRVVRLYRKIDAAINTLPEPSRGRVREYVNSRYTAERKSKDDDSETPLLKQAFGA